LAEKLNLIFSVKVVNSNDVVLKTGLGLKSFQWRHQHYVTEKRHQNNITKIFPIWAPPNQNLSLRQWSWVNNLMVFIKKRSWSWKNSFGLGPTGLKKISGLGTSLAVNKTAASAAQFANYTLLHVYSCTTAASSCATRVQTKTSAGM